MPVYEEKETVNGQKRWFVRTYVTDEFGNSKQITRHNKNWIGRDGKKEAEREEIRLKSKTINTHEKDTFDKLATEFLLTKKQIVKESTWIKENSNYNNYIKMYFQNKYYHKLTTIDIKKWKDIMENKNLALNTKKNVFITLSQILDYGCQYYGLEKNVAKIVKNFKSKKGYKKNEMKFITNEQFEKAIKFEPSYIYYVAFNILFYTGIRRGELLALNKFTDIDFDNNTIIIDETINPKISTIPTPPKTDKSNRKIQILPFLVPLLKNIIQNDKSEDGYFFLHTIKLTTLKRKCDNMLKKIGLNENELIRIHDLRHSFASFCINSGVEIQILSDYMGHENISITLDTYGHLYPNSQKKLLEKITNKLIKQD